MPLPRRNGRFQVFSRLDKEKDCRLWCVAKVEQGQLKILETSSSWRITMEAAELAATGRRTEMGKWLDSYDPERTTLGFLM